MGAIRPQVTSMARLGGIRTRDGEKPAPTLRERIRALRYVPRLIGLIWETHHGLTLAMGALDAANFSQEADEVRRGDFLAFGDLQRRRPFACRF